jgi:hypothetical protein
MLGNFCKLDGGHDVSTRREYAQQTASRRSYSRREILRSSEALAVREHFADRSREFVHARARHDDCVAAAVCFFSDAQKLPAIVFAQLDMKIFALNLNLAGLDDVIHLRPGCDSARPICKMEDYFCFQTR